MFDLAKTSSLDAADAGSFLPLTDPVTGEVFRDDLGEEIGVTLRSRLSHVGQSYQRDNASKRLEMSRRGQEVSVDTLEAETTEMLVALTVSWTFTHLDGADFSCTPDNARKMWSDPRFRGFRERANAHIGNEANFTKR